MSELILLRRYFWRRSLAAVIDTSLAAILSVLVLLPVLGNPDKIRLDALGIVTKQCINLTSAPQDALNLLAPAQPAGGVACREYVFGVDNGTTFTLMHGAGKTASFVVQRDVSFPVNDFGSPVTPFMPQSLLMFALLVGIGGWLLRQGWQSPGKTLLGLRVVEVQAHPFQREVLKYIFLLINGIFANLIWLLGTSIVRFLDGRSTTIILTSVLVAGLVLSAYYLLPLIRWRGAMPWDQVSGSFVQRKI